jgi:hypothetical protein
MADSIRQQIIDAVDTRFKAIKTSAGYKTNIGNHVYDWLDRDLADNELDALIYRDKTNDIESASFSDYDNKLTLEIEVKTKSGGTTAKQVRQMIEDVYRAIGTDETWSGLSINTEPRSDAMDLGQADKIVGSGTIIVEIMYQTTKWQY